MQGLTPLFSVSCHEPEGEYVRNVYPLIFTPENIQKFAQKALQFPTLFGREIKDVSDMVSMFFEVQKDGTFKFKGSSVFYVVDDFVGVFSLTDFSYDYSDAIAHYTFLDRRHKGRTPLVKAMMKYAFDTFKLNRLSVEVPLYTKEDLRHFITGCGFTLEGKKRKAIKYDGTLFDILLFGILKSEV